MLIQLQLPGATKKRAYCFFRSLSVFWKKGEADDEFNVVENHKSTKSQSKTVLNHEKMKSFFLIKFDNKKTHWIKLISSFAVAAAILKKGNRMEFHSPPCPGVFLVHPKKEILKIAQSKTVVSFLLRFFLFQLQKVIIHENEKEKKK